MINKLTPEQEAKIPLYFDKWKKIGHGCEPINRPLAIDALKEYLAIADIHPKVFLFLDSPMACELAINIFKIGFGLRDQFSDQPYRQLGDQLDNQLDNPLHKQLSDQLHKQLSDQLYGQLSDQLYGQLGDQLYRQLDNQLNNQLHNQLDNQLNNQLDDPLSNQLGDQLYGQLYNQLDNQLGDQLHRQLHKQLSYQLHKQLYDQLSDQLHKQLNNQLCNQLHNQLRDQLSQKLEYFPIRWFYQSGNTISGYCAFFDFLVSEVKKPCNKTMNAWENFKKVTEELHYFFIYKDIVFCSQRPIEMHYNGTMLHNTRGPSILYRDGYALYTLNGVAVSKDLVMTTAEDLDPKMILTEKNAEIRREIVRKIGVERLIIKLGAKSLDKSADGIYELLNINLGDNQIRPYLKMRNPSIATWHVEGVHPNCKTVESALKWRNQTANKPEQLT